MNSKELSDILLDISPGNDNYDGEFTGSKVKGMIHGSGCGSPDWDVISNGFTGV